MKKNPVGNTPAELMSKQPGGRLFKKLCFIPKWALSGVSEIRRNGSGKARLLFTKTRMQWCCFASCQEVLWGLFHKHAPRLSKQNRSNSFVADIRSPGQTVLALEILIVVQRTWVEFDLRSLCPVAA